MAAPNLKENGWLTHHQVQSLQRICVSPQKGT